MEGIGGRGGGMQAPDLLRTFEREKRIIYEERVQDNSDNSDNSTVGFATASTSVTEGIEVDIPLMLNRPAPEDGLVLVASSDEEDVVVMGGGMRISPGVQKGQYIRVSVNADDIPEEYETVRIVLAEPSEGLPEGWQIGRREHVLMISPHGFKIAFEQSSSEVDEDVGTVNLVLVLNQPAPAGLVLNVSSDSEENAVPTSSTLTVPEGVRRVDLPVRVVNDELGEGDGLATIHISDAGENSMPEGWSVGSQDTHELTIRDDDSDLGFKKASSEVRESDLNAGIEIAISGACSSTGEINLTVAAEGNDGNDISFETLVPISAGEEVKTFIVEILPDDFPEDAEQFRFTLSGELPESCEYGRRVHDLTILPNGKEVVFEEESTNLKEGENDGTVDVALKLNYPAPDGLVLAFASSSPGDAVPTSPTLRVPVGATSATLTVRVINDDIGELNETVTISILGNSPTSLPEGWSIGSQDTHDLILTDDDLSVGFESSFSRVHESDLMTDLRIVLSETGAPMGGMSLSVSATGNDENDVSFSSLLPISSGEDRKNLRVMLTQDGFAEDEERIVLMLSGELPSPWKFGQRTHELTILSNEQTAMFAEAGKTVNEGDGSTSFKVTLSADAPAGGVPLKVAITSGNDDNDVTFRTQTFTIAEGSLEHTIRVDINNDNLVEPNETITFTLTKDANAAFPDAWGGLGTQTTFDLVITDDDSATIGFTTSSSTLLEGDTGATLTVQLTGSVSQDVAVTLGESGDGNNDLAFSPNALTFEPGGETSKTVTLTVNTANDDVVPEADFDITYTLAGSLPGGVNFATRQHVVTFVDDDKTIKFKDPASSAGEGTNGHPVAVVLNFDPPSKGLDVTAVAKGEHKDEVSIPSPTLKFIDGTRELSLSVNVLKDNIQEDAEVVHLELEETAVALPEGWTLLASGANDHDLTILPSGQTAMFAEAGKTVSEDVGTTSFNVVLSADAPADGVPLEVAITSGNENGDVTFTTQNFTIAEGSREHTLTVDVNDDDQVESSETVVFALSKGGNFPESWGGLGMQKTFDLTITDNDEAKVCDIDLKFYYQSKPTGNIPGPPHLVPSMISLVSNDGGNINNIEEIISFAIRGRYDRRISDQYFEILQFSGNVRSPRLFVMGEVPEGCKAEIVNKSPDQTRCTGCGVVTLNEDGRHYIGLDNKQTGRAVLEIREESESDPNIFIRQMIWDINR